MKRFKSIIFIVVFQLLFTSGIVYGAFTGEESIWNFHGLASGDFPQWTGWHYGQTVIDENGNSTVTSFLNSDGDTTLPPTTTLDISPDGIITNQSIPSYHGTVSLNRDLVVVTMTNPEPDGSYFLQIIQKAGGTFTTSDLQGTWNYHSLVSGDSPQWTGWYYGQAAVDAGGNVTQISFLNSDGDTTLPPNNTIAITSDGIVTEVGGSFHGAMNIGKNLIAATINDGGGGYTFQVAQKSGGTFTNSDLEGTWNGHLLTSGDSPQWIGWAHFRATIDSSGILTFTSITRSDGNSSLPPDKAISITSNGVITPSPGDLSFHGTMSQGKNMIVATLDDGGGGYDLLVMQRTCEINDGVYGWLLGDINLDCKVDISDVILVLRMALGLDALKPCADINDDGVVDISDVILTLRMALGLDPLQQCNKWECQDDDEANGIYRICNYFPLDPGNQWNYTTGDRFILDDIRTCTSGYSGILYGTNTYEFSPYMQNGEYGLLFAGCQYDEGVLEDWGISMTLIRPQMQIGETVSTYIPPGVINQDGTTFDTTLVGLETITVPAGVFETLKIEILTNDIGKCSYKTTLWLAKGIGPVKIQRTEPNPADCLGCMFVCDPDNNVDKLNTPAELTSAIINGVTYP